jgi:hypothetical protein
MLPRLLSLVPFVGLVIGIGFANRVEPRVFGMPFLLAWVVAWLFISVGVMALVYRLDPTNRTNDGEEAGR